MKAFTTMGCNKIRVFFRFFFSKIWKVQFIVYFFCSIQYLANQFYIFYKSNTSVNTSTIDE